jgi:hypothetical protein
MEKKKANKKCVDFIKCDSCGRKFKRRSLLTYKDKLLCTRCYKKARGDKINIPGKIEPLKLLMSCENKGRKVQNCGSIYFSKSLAGKRVKFRILEID